MHYAVSIAIRDEPGSLALVTRRLASWYVNLDGMVASADGLRVVVTDPEPITKALEEGGFLYRIQEVQEIQLPDRPGALAELCHRLSESGVNILQAFGVASRGAGNVFIAVDDWGRAAPIMDLYTKGAPIIHPRLGRIA